MIERYTIAKSQEEIEQRFKANFSDSFSPHFNAAPTQPLPIITSGNPNAIKFYNWGTEPSASTNKRIASKLINAPVNELTEKVFYKNGLKSRRCTILADGFYVWNSIAKKRHIPYRITLQDEALFAMAGLWETYENIDGERVGTFNVITRTAASSIHKITSEMPVILDESQEANWLQATNSIEDSLSILNQPFGQELKSYAVSPLVNNLANDSENLLKPAPPADQFGNYSLFD